jgi:hypothetical protein
MIMVTITDMIMRITTARPNRWEKAACWLP